MKKQNLLSALVFLGIAAVYCFPVFINIHNWGQMEWDQFTFWNAVPRATILQYHQFPLWNPYAEGGNVLLAHPHSLFLSPFYIFVLIFGPVIGLKLEIFIHLVVGLWGMYRLARFLSMERIAAYFSAIVFMLNSMYALHLTEGHTEWLVMAFVPWFFLYLMKSFKDTRQALVACVFLSLMTLGGSVDVLSITLVLLPIYVVLKCIQQKSIGPLLPLIIILIGAFALCAVKLLPMLEFIRQYPRLTPERDGSGLSVLYDMLLSREQAYWDTLNWDATQRMGLSHGWHEYGAYVGVIPVLLFILGASRFWERHWPLFWTGIVSLLVALGTGSVINLWGTLHKLPMYDSLTVPSRFVLGFIFSLALFSGLGLSSFTGMISGKIRLKKKEFSRWIGFFILAVVFADLWSVNSPIFRHAFVITPLEVKHENEFHQRYVYRNFHEKDQFHNIVGEEVSNSSMYPIFLSNSGILEGNEVMRISPWGDVKVLADPHYLGEAYLANGDGDVRIKYFSPNRVILDVNADVSERVVLNQNYYTGWNVRIEKERTAAVPWNGLISAPVQAGHQEVEFYYLPLSFLAGALITLISWGALVYFYRTKRVLPS